MRSKEVTCKLVTCLLHARTVDQHLTEMVGKVNWVYCQRSGVGALPVLIATKIASIWLDGILSSVKGLDESYELKPSAVFTQILMTSRKFSNSFVRSFFSIPTAGRRDPSRRIARWVIAKSRFVGRKR